MAANIRSRVAQILESGQAQDPFSRVIDLFLIALIILNVIAIVLESVASLLIVYAEWFRYFEIFSVAVFSIEYLARVWSAIELDRVDTSRPVLARLKYMLTPLVLIDLLSILPFYLSFFIALDLRFLRVLRLLRIFKLTRYSAAMSTMLEVLREEVSVLSAAAFILFILLVLASSGIYLVEHDVQPDAFGSIPSSMWWAMVTLTTVGYGDVTPITPLGKFFGALIALIGVGMVALPTGILASGFANAFRRRRISYQQQLGIALDDGKISEEEAAALRRIQFDLGLSEEDAAHIYDMASRRLRRMQQYCPNCGGNLEMPPTEKSRPTRAQQSKNTG